MQPIEKSFAWALVMDSQCLSVGHHPGALQRYLALDFVQAAVLQLTLLGQFPVGFYPKMSKLGAVHLSLERETKLLGLLEQRLLVLLGMV